MTKVKKIVTIAVCLAVAAGGGTGGTLLYRSRQAKKHEVDVMPVANMVQYYWGDDLSMDGQVVSGDVQNVTPSNDQLVEKVLVKEGDHVTKGTPLLQYDMTAVGLEVAQKQTALAVAQDNVRQAKKELERIQKLKPSEEAPVIPDYPDYPDEPDEPDTPDTPGTPKDTLAAVTALTQAAAGSGSESAPFQFACTGTTVVKQAVLDQLKASGQCAVFVVYSDQGEVLYGWLVRGSQLTATGDWTLGQNVTVTEDGGVQISGNGVWYGTLQVGGTFDYDPAGGDDSSGDTTQPADTTPGTSDDAASAPGTQTTSPDTTAAPTAQMQGGFVITPMAAIQPMASAASDSASASASTSDSALPDSTTQANTGSLNPGNFDENSAFSITGTTDAFAPCLGWGPGVSGCSLKSVIAAASLLQWAESTHLSSRTPEAIQDAFYDWYDSLSAADQENFAEAWTMIEPDALSLLSDKESMTDLITDAGLDPDTLPGCTLKNWQALQNVLDSCVPAVNGEE